MKILQILPELNVGGVETGTVDLAKYLTQAGHGIVVVSNGGGLVGELEASGIKHYQLPVHRKSLGAALKSIRRLEEIIRDEEIDIVHARSRVPAWIAFFACRKTKAAFLTTCHGYYGSHFFSRVMGWPKLVITPSEVIAKHMINDFGVQHENIRLIPRSVDLEKFSVPRPMKTGRQEYTIAIVGRITPLKGHIYFIQAMAKVVRSLPTTRIWIIGDAPAKKEAYKEELQVMVKRLGLSQYVEFLGNRRDVPQLLARADVLVLSTITEEAFGRVILEAQAAGVPVVATKVGGVTEIIDDGKTGILVLPKDIDEMARAVIRVLRDRRLSEGFVAAAKEKLNAKFTLEHMAEKTIKVYEELQKSLNILVIKLSSAGDVVLVSASLKALRERFPLAKIACLTTKDCRDILKRCPYINDVIVYDPKGKDKGLTGLWKFGRKLRTYKFDKVVDFQNSRKSHILSALSLPLESYGYDRKFGFLLSRRIKDTKEPMAPVAHQFQLLGALGIDMAAQTKLELWPSSEDERYANGLLDAEWLGSHPAIVGINIAASERWATKNWPIEYIGRLCDLLSLQNIRVALTGAEKDKERAQGILKLTKAKPANLVGKTNFLQLAALMKRFKAYITPDSAPMHIAAAVGTPFLALFGPTAAERHLPPAQAGRFSVLKRDLACAPCYSTSCKIKTHACMKEITPETVAQAIETLIKSTQ